MTTRQVILTYLLTIVAVITLNHNVIGEQVVTPKPVPTAGNVTNTSTIQKPPTTTNITSVAAEGGQVDLPAPNADTTHNGREHMQKIAPTRPVIPLNNSGVVSSTEKSDSKHMIQVAPVVRNNTVPKIDQLPPIETAEKNDNKKSVPKKGVDPPPANVTKSTTTTVRPVKSKPTITESSDDDPLPANSKLDQSSEKHNDIPSLDQYSKENSKKADYIVPIVAVILSVPLVAIIISVLYKRGAEWWQHRHYRRMDFLIDGMYNN